MNSISSANWSDSFPRSLSDVQRVYEEISDAIDPLHQSLKRAIGEHPIKSIVVSLATGVLLGWLVKR